MSDIVAGRAPPMVVPYCRLCDMPAEKFAVVGGKALHDKLVVAELPSAYYIDIEAKCCGKTQGKRVSIDEILALRRTNAKLYLVTRAGQYQGVGEFRRAF